MFRGLRVVAIYPAIFAFTVQDHRLRYVQVLHALVMDDKAGDTWQCRIQLKAQVRVRREGLPV